MKTYHMYIDGGWSDASDGAVFDAVDPWKQEPFAQLPEGTAADVDRAVAAAKEAFLKTDWTRNAHQRAVYLRNLADLLDQNAEGLALLESTDNGKVIREERGMYGAISGYFRYYADLVSTIAGEVPPGRNPDVLSITRRAPYGVIGIQTPWNTPGVILAQSLAPALAAGNTVVIKPSELAPVSTLAIAKLIEEAGFPAGVVNVVTGFGAVVGARLCEHPDVAKLVFTGSPEGGRLVARAAAERLAPVVMELGGKSANVVFADADVKAATLAVAQGFTAAGGQSCMAGGRAIIHESLVEEVLQGVIEYLETLQFGDPSLDTTDVGPICAAPQVERIEKYVAKGQEQGATLVYGGGAPDGVDHPLFYKPTVFTNVSSDMAIWKEEVFGPVLAIMPFKTEAEAIELANGTEFGLSLALWSTNLDRAHRVSEALEAGVVWVNHYRRGDPSFPNGGIRYSGYGRVSGVEGYHEMTYPKSIQILLNSQPNDGE